MNISQEEFIKYKPLLFSLGYRMLGSVTDAEDLVQETFLRCYQIDTVQSNLKAYLCKVMTNLCIDLLKSSRYNREQYTGEWNPEPLLVSQDEPSFHAIQKEGLSIAYLRMMEHLSPYERAVLILREAFHLPYQDIAKMIHKQEANCRKLFSRAKTKISSVEAESLSYDQNRILIERFIKAFQTQNIAELLQLLSEDVTLYSDGGGIVKAAIRPIKTHSHVLAFFNGITRKAKKDFRVSIHNLNEQPTIVIYIDDTIYSVISFYIRDQCINEMYMTNNPNKLNHLQPVLTIPKGD
ncbi:RNA polymerase sigma-70 factor [Halalkalibacter sp. AB-rgal2]|uniref:RNA polymerase sigma-70 factor n=1 Tax=Halalkalibacter sp. AB-rgal2 TaxID=3242695 RepID=UPI00359D06C6